MPAQIVTLLFTDLVGSSALLEQLGDDAGEKMRRTHFGLLRDAVADAGGEEVKNLGDGLMVAFDSGVRAVECAIAMQRSFDRHNRQTGASQLEVRVGLHVGEPIRDEDDYFGTAVVVAKRLCDAAQGGQILASDLVRGLVASRGGYAFRPVADVALKGMGRDVVAFDVDWAPVAAASPSGVIHPDPRVLRLVGRQRELEDMEADLARAAQGRLGVVLLVGEPGVGKTRLSQELLARHQGEMIGLSARAYPLGATASLGLWVEALERHLRTLPAAELEELCGAQVDDLATLLPAVRAVRSGDNPTEAPRIRLLGGLAAILARLAERAPVVLVFDDVHLADPSSWEALNFLARNLNDSRLLVVLAARPVELSEQQLASDVLLGLEQEGLLRRTTVRAMSADEVRELAELVIDGPASPALVEWIMERAQGSPLFANGLLRALIDEGADLEHPHLASLPEDLAERVGARLKHLDPQAGALLEMLSVLGYRAELGDLLRVSGRTLDELAPALERLARERLVSEEEQGRELTYEVAHPLIQEAIYQGIGGARRRALHRPTVRCIHRNRRTTMTVLTDETLERFAGRTASYDRENSFFQEDFNELRDSGYLVMAVPTELGGLGLNLAQVCQEMRRLCRRSPATALATNMHVYWTGLAADLWRQGDKSCQWILEDAVAGEVFAAGHGEAGNDFPLMLSTTRAEKVEGGYKFYGHKTFGSLSPVWTRLGLHGMDSSDPDNPVIVHAFLPRDSDGYTITETWDTLGMRATRSDDTILDGAFVPDANIPRIVPAGLAGADSFVLGVFGWAQPTFASVYIGIAERALELAVASVSKKTSIALGGKTMAYNPMVQHQIAEMALELEAITAHVERIADDWSNGVDHGGAWPMKLVAAKYRAVEGAKKIVDLAMDVSGGSGMFKSNELERMYRDVRCGGFHPANSALVHEIVGKSALGILDAEPRWG